MKKSRVKKTSPAKRLIGIFGATASAALLPAAAMAGALSLVYASLEMPDSLVAKWLIRPLAVIGAGGVGASGGGLPTSVGSTTSTTTPPTAQIRPTKISMNLEPADYYSSNRIFSNLASGSGWEVRPADNGPADSYYNSNRDVIKVVGNDRIFRPILRPTGVFQRKSVDIVCRWDGVGTLYFDKPSGVKNFIQGPNTARYTQLYEGDGVGWMFVYLKTVDANNPIRNIDCRETNADRNALFDPTYLASLKKYTTVRFMKWQNTEANANLTWANRTTPAMGPIRGGGDGYAIEYMIELANQAKVNPWFTLSWNADDDYVRKFAEMVRDKLDPNLKAYVETSNEVWNWVYPVTTQAANEGLAEGLSTNMGEAMLRRYAERTGQQMDIWKDVFTGQASRLVRVAASQNANSWTIETIVNFRDTASKIDAISSAPYFGTNLNDYTGSRTDMTAYFTNLKTVVDGTIRDALKFKKLADQKGLRFVAYEGGQHVLGDDLDLQTKIQYDPRMGDMYTYYLTRWNNEIGDDLVLFNDYGQVSRFGAWGMFDYVGQPTNATPKGNALTLFQASIGK